MRHTGRTALLLAMAMAMPLASRAAEAPYETQLLRLAEVLGSVHYLRNLCGETGNTWRERMETLLSTENPDPERRARLIASFNRGYRSYQSTYLTCTPSAALAISRHMDEGESLSRDIVSRYGN